MSQGSGTSQPEVWCLLVAGVAMALVVLVLASCQAGAALQTPSPTPTKTPRPAPTDTATPSPTATPLPPTPSFTPQPTPTETQVPPTSTSTPVAPTSTPEPEQPTSTPTATSTAASSCPARPEPLILDVTGQPRDWAWIQDNFNLTREQLIGYADRCPGGLVYAVVELREYHDTSLRVTVLDQNGAPKAGVSVAFFGFPDDVVDTAGECRPSATVKETNGSGQADQPMGSGSAYYPDLGQLGYHAMWIRDSIASDCVQNVGMVIRNYHSHLTVTYREIGR